MEVVLAFLENLQPWAKAGVELLALALVAMASGVLARVLLLHAVRGWRLGLPKGWAQVLLHDPVLVHLAKATPSVVVQLGLRWVEYLPLGLSTALHNLAVSFTIYHLVRAVCALLQELNAFHERGEGRADARDLSIKSYVQLGKLLAWVVGLLLIAATLMDRSPVLLLSGLGAMSAVLMLVFKDTILSFVAGVQLASNDMLRVGDWIEMPKEGANGAVVDITLNIVKVQNWDKTISTIPTWKLMSESFKNWRGMFDAGGRRILRALHIDATTVRPLTDAQRTSLAGQALLQDFWQQQAQQPQGALLAGEMSNLAVFSAYTLAYLRAHPGIAKGPGMHLLVRMLEPTAMGIPLQLYCYTASTVWVEHEAMQSAVFDHLITVMPEFGLAVYQRSSDYGSRLLGPVLSMRDGT